MQRGVQRRDRRVLEGPRPSLGGIRSGDLDSEVVAEHVGHVAGDHTEVRRRTAQVVDAVQEVGPADALDRAELVTDPKERERGVVRARRLATDDEWAVVGFDQRVGDGQAVVGTGWKGVLGGQAVVDRHHVDPELRRQVGVGHVHAPGAAGHHPAAVEVQVGGPARAVAEDPAGHPSDQLVPTRRGEHLEGRQDRPLGGHVGRRATRIGAHLGDGGGHRPGLLAQGLVLGGPELGTGHVRCSSRSSDRRRSTG